MGSCCHSLWIRISCSSITHGSSTLYKCQSSLGKHNLRLWIRAFSGGHCVYCLHGTKCTCTTHRISFCICAFYLVCHVQRMATSNCGKSITRIFCQAFIWSIARGTRSCSHVSLLSILNIIKYDRTKVCTVYCCYFRPRSRDRFSSAVCAGLAAFFFGLILGSGLSFPTETMESFGARLFNDGMPVPLSSERVPKNIYAGFFLSLSIFDIVLRRIRFSDRRCFNAHLTF
mmetsp:Transcript_8895/g.16030  ORF Transcript_8895/g.16030 Transcript_8895/m.16030 type:complete len:229 (+) Transcript_8895:481-1167(+)